MSTLLSIISCWVITLIISNDSLNKLIKQKKTLKNYWIFSYNTVIVKTHYLKFSLLQLCKCQQHFINLKGQCNFQVFNNFTSFESLYMARIHILRTKNTEVFIESRRNKQIEAPSNYKINFIQIHTWNIK